jgi:hypothetical protein
MKINSIQEKLHEVRGYKAMLDFDLAELYDVETKILNRAVKRNLKRFPEDFMFRLTKVEWESLRFQTGTLKPGSNSLRFQIGTSKGKGGTRYLPFAFTEQGVSMLSAVLNSQKAVDVSIMIIRTFVMLRQYAINYSELKLQIKKLEKTMNRKFKSINEALKYLLNKDQLEIEQRDRRRIGYK